MRFHGKRRAKIDPRSAEFDVEETSHHFFTRLPLNEILRLDVSRLDARRAAARPRARRAFDRPSFRLPLDRPRGQGVSSARSSARSNELQPDLVALTGDLVESTACLDWIPDTLGRLTARYGVYFILGNHDLRTRDVPRLRRMLEQSGLIDLGGRRRQIEINGQPVVLMGNELPWIKHEPAAVCHASQKQCAE